MSESKLNLNIKSSITTLQKLLEDTNQLFELPEEQRIGLFKAAVPQTVRRPLGFYFHLMENEKLPINKLPKINTNTVKRLHYLFRRTIKPGSQMKILLSFLRKKLKYTIFNYHLIL